MRSDAILKETFQICAQPYSVFLFHHQLAWCPQKKGGEDMSEWINVKMKDILNVEVTCKREEDKGSRSNCCLLNPLKEKPTMIYSQVLIVHYAQQKKKSAKWKHIQLLLSHNDNTLLNKWYNTIQGGLEDFRRPKNLLFFVNPYGGRRKAVSIFDLEVKPILEVCRIQWTMIQTQRNRHATETLAAMSDDKLKEYDAVVAVGGDGTICEVVSGLLTRNTGSSSNMQESDLQSVPIPVAFIGAGSTNALAFTLNGTDDPRTSTIHIVLGGSLPLDVGAIHNHSGINRFIIGQMSYGYFADILLQSESLRWMGPKRYDYAGACKLLGNVSYEGSIDVKVGTDDNRRIASKCKGSKGCVDCNMSKSKPSGEWKRLEGQFIGISSASISCCCARSPNGMAPFAHLSDGYMELMLIRKTSRFNYIRYLLRLAQDSRRVFTLPFVERYRVSEFVFTPGQCCNNNIKSLSLDSDSSNAVETCGCEEKENKKHSVWNCDGELLYQPSVKVTVHRNLIRILTRIQCEECMHPVAESPSSIDLDAASTSLTVSTMLLTRSPSVETKNIDNAISLEDCRLEINHIRY